MPYQTRPRQDIAPRSSYRGGPMFLPPGTGIGRGQPQTQILYHQQGGRQQQGPQLRQQNQAPMPGYSTQQPPPPQQQVPPPQQQAPPPQQQAPPPQQPQPQSQPKLEPPPTPPILSMDAEDSKEEVGDELRPKWAKKRGGVTKVSKKIKKRRQNARLRKILQPKNAIMILNELRSGVKFSFQEQMNALQQVVYIVTVEVEGKMYVGQGLSKAIAKQNAAENALKGLLIEQMASTTIKEDVEMATEENNVEANGENAKPKQPPPEDEVPWGSLASFALFKLFSEWQSQGTQVPLTKQGQPIPGAVVAAAAAAAAAAEGQSPMKKIPENPTDRHPVMLLNQMKPGIQFTEVGVDGTLPNLTFTMSVNVNNEVFRGSGKNKKEAKKEAAKAALAAVFGINYN